VSDIFDLTKNGLFDDDALTQAVYRACRDDRNGKCWCAQTGLEPAKPPHLGGPSCTRLVRMVKGVLQTYLNGFDGSRIKIL
jgi:hypothetical protein